MVLIVLIYQNICLIFFNNFSSSNMLFISSFLVGHALFHYATQSRLHKKSLFKKLIESEELVLISVFTELCFYVSINLIL